MNILVTGGAGYIGSACVRRMISLGHNVVVIDNLSRGKQKFVDEKAEFCLGDLTDLDFVDKVFSNHKFDAIIHFAAYKSIPESMKNPEKYSDNIKGTMNLLNAMTKFDVKKIIFSSTAAVYGVPEYMPVDEKHPTNPISYYGFTKLKSEELICWYGKLKGIIGISLRYFNVSGDAGLNYVDFEAENVFPLLLDVFQGRREKFVIFGGDYDTRDGTGIRDYIDINDLIGAHILALDLDKSETINLGTAEGTSVKGLVIAFEEAIGKKLNWEIGPRREGDTAKFVASFDKAKNVLGWKPEKTVKEMVESTIGVYGK